MAELRRRGSTVLVAAGLALIGCSLAGVTRCGRYVEHPPRPGERFDPELADSARDLDALYAVARQRAGTDPAKLEPEQAMVTLFEVVSDRFTHGPSHHSLLENWVAWLGAKVYAPVATIRDPATVVRYGHSGLCSEQSSVLLSLGRRAGIRVRQVWLDGHVVMEAFHGGGWHVYDPDLEVIPRLPGGQIASSAQLAADRKLTARVYRDHDPVLMADVFASVGDNIYRDGPGSPRALAVERATHWLKWLVPAFMVIVGLALARRRADATLPSPG